MSEEMLMNITPVETRVALVENGVLQEVFVEREQSRGIVGNIYLGKVVRVLPGMQAAFVDIGLEKASYIHVSDIQLESAGNAARADDISVVVREGQDLLVQVIKDPLGTKGARLSTSLSISSRNLVLMPRSSHIGVSTRIEDAEIREKLKAGLIKTLAEENGVAEGGDRDSADTSGYIIRTAAELVEAQEFVADIRYLKRLWAVLERRIASQQAPSLIYEEPRLAERVIRDNVYFDLEKVRVDHQAAFDRLSAFSEKYVPEYVGKLELYDAERPIFDLFSVEEEIQKALGKKVDLKSGGYLIIDQTEALTTIDVNTGAFVGHRNQEETVFKTNLEAAAALARQLRLRNLGGIVIVDFIDMQSDEHRRQVLRMLHKSTRRDRSKIYMSTFSELGLIEMTRKRTSESLEHILCETCTVCDGRGSIRSTETVCADIFREIVRAARAYEHNKLLVVASQSVVDRLLDEDATVVDDLQGLLGKSIAFQVDSMYAQEQYDVVFL